MADWTDDRRDDEQVEPDPPAPTGPTRYNGFISYSHGQDSEFAEALERALQRLARPWNQRRALNVFRDSTGLAATSSLWPELVTRLDQSEYLLLLCSPLAAQSPWVGREIERWLTTKGPRTILLIVTDGAVVWDDAASDFDWSRSNAVHPALQGAFHDEPFHIDMSGAESADQLTLGNAQYRADIARIAAPLHHFDGPGELIGEDVRQQRRTKRILRAGVASLAVLTVVALGMGAVAFVQRAEAVDQRELAEANAMEADANAVEAEANAIEALTQQGIAEENEAEAVRQAEIADERARESESRRLAQLTDVQGGDGALPFLLALTAYELSPTSEARARLFDLAGNDAASTQNVTNLVGHDEKVLAAEFSPSGDHVATLDAVGTLRIWPTGDASDPVEITTSAGSDIAFVDDDTIAIAVGAVVETRGIADGSVQGSSGNLGAEVTAIAGPLSTPAVVAGLSDGGVVVVDPAGVATTRDASITGFVGAVVVSADGRTIATTSGPEVAVRTENLRVQRQLGVGSRRVLGLSPSGRQLILGGVRTGLGPADGDLSVIDTFTGNELPPVSAGGFPVSDAVWTRTVLSAGQEVDEIFYVATSNVDSPVGVGFVAELGPQGEDRPEPFTEQSGFATPSSALVVAASRDGSHILTAGLDPVARLTSRSSANDNGRSLIPTEWQDGFSRLPVTISADARVVTTLGPNGAALIDIDDGTVVEYLGGASRAAVTPDGSAVIMSDGVIADSRTGEVLGSAITDPAAFVGAASFSDDSRTVAYASQTESSAPVIAVADLPTGDAFAVSIDANLCGATGCSSDRIKSLTLSPDGTRLIAVLFGEPVLGQPWLEGTATVIVAEVTNGWELLTTFRVTGGGPAVFVDATTAWLYDDGRVRTLDLATMELSNDGPTHFVRDLPVADPWLLSPDGTRLLELGACGVEMIALPDWSPLLTFLWDGDITEAGCGGSSGGWLSDSEVVAADAGNIRLWALSDESLTGSACALAGRNLTQAEWDQFVGFGEYLAACPAFTAPHEVETTDGPTAGANSPPSPESDEPIDEQPETPPEPSDPAVEGDCGATADEIATALLDATILFPEGETAVFVDGEFTRPPFNGLPGGYIQIEPLVADLNGDCRLDALLVTDSSLGARPTPGLMPLLQTPAGEFESSATYQWNGRRLDSARLKPDSIELVFELFNEGDATCCPTGTATAEIEFETLAEAQAAGDATNPIRFDGDDLFPPI